MTKGLSVKCLQYCDISIVLLIPITGIVLGSQLVIYIDTTDNATPTKFTHHY